MQETTNQRRRVITAARGRLRIELLRILGSRAEGVSRDSLDIADAHAVSQFLHEKRPAVVVNTAAWTNVDAAEKLDHKRKCHRINAEAVAVLTAACADAGCLLVQISNDYVFGGDEPRQKPYREDDCCAPVTVYGESKRVGEEAAASLSQHLIVRTSGLYSIGKDGPVWGRNFADTMQILGNAGKPLHVVADQWCTPSFVPDVAAAVVRLVEADATGIVHVVNQGQTTWHGFAEELFRQQGTERDGRSNSNCRIPGTDETPTFQRALDRSLERDRRARTSAVASQPLSLPVQSWWELVRGVYSNLLLTAYARHGKATSGLDRNEDEFQAGNHNSHHRRRTRPWHPSGWWGGHKTSSINACNEQAVAPHL